VAILEGPKKRCGSLGPELGDNRQIGQVREHQEAGHLAVVRDATEGIGLYRRKRANNRAK